MKYLVRNGLLNSPEVGSTENSQRFISTVCTQIMNYGYIPSAELIEQIKIADQSKIKSWLQNVVKTLKSITGADKQMDRFVVYKNFPQEVMDMSQGEYWFNQICMYFGLPNELFTEEEVDRDPLFEDVSFKVLHLATEDRCIAARNKLGKNPARWTEEQYTDFKAYFSKYPEKNIVSRIVFKENLARFVVDVWNDYDLSFTSGTDVLRIGTALCGGDVSLVENCKFKFKRSDRRKLLSFLEQCSNLEEDVARNKNKWKVFLHGLHPNDYSWAKKSQKIQHLLYNNKIQSFASKVERAISLNDSKLWSLLESRPGEFSRMIQRLLSKYGSGAIESFKKVLPSLTTFQLLKLKSILLSANGRENRLAAPRGNWSKVKLLSNPYKNDRLFTLGTLQLNQLITNVLMDRHKDLNVNLSPDVSSVKLQTNDNSLCSFGRGTSFLIPDNVKFIRTASYWKCKTIGNNWFDNGWNFFNSKWEALGSCCWNVNQFGNKAAIFSGDPTNSKDLEGRACQMIDLYIQDLKRAGVRYAVWNILCFSKLPFSSADEVFAALQWGEEAQEGKLFEPQRCQLSFPINDNSLTKYIAMIDLQKMELIYLDANLPGSVQSASNNQYNLQEFMPAYMDYLNTIPSMYDLFSSCNMTEDGMPVLYSDVDVNIDSEKAYVFQQENEDNKFVQFDYTELLNMKG